MNNDLLSKQEKLYHNLNFSTTKNKGNVAIIKHFIASEKEAREHNFQGQFYPSYHYQLGRVMSTKLSKISDNDIFLSFYYRLKLGIIDKPLEQHFPLFLKAVKHNLDDDLDDDLESHILSSACLYILFGVKQNVNYDAVSNIVYVDFLDSLKFKNLCEAYTCFPNLRKKSKRFSSFIINTELMNRIKYGLPFYFESNFITAGSLVLLLSDTKNSSKDILLSLHKNNLNNTSVWLLGSFYKDFQKTDANKNVLKDLYVKYPKEWIDEYQEITNNKLEESFI